MTEVRMKATPPRPVLTKKLNVEAACINNTDGDPPNLFIVSVTDAEGRPVTGLTGGAFTLVNYNPQGNPQLRVVDFYPALSEALPDAAIDGVYSFCAKAEPGSVSPEPELLHHVGITAYAIKVMKTEGDKSHITQFSGQTVLSVVMLPEPRPAAG
jgi:hypothetical protein